MKNAITPTVRRHLDEQIDSFRSVVAAPRPPKGWVNAIRRGLGMTERELAERMGIKQSSLHGLESSEADGTIRLNTLRRAAEALGCELVYIVIPPERLEQIVTERALALAREEMSRVGQTMSLEAQDVALSDSLLEERAREILAGGNLWRRR